jgi:hypothetical protein
MGFYFLSVFFYFIEMADDESGGLTISALILGTIDENNLPPS